MMRNTILCLLTSAVAAFSATLPQPKLLATPNIPGQWSGTTLDKTNPAPECKASMVWKHSDAKVISLQNVPTNLTEGGFNAIEIWIYSKKGNKGRMLFHLASENKEVPGADYYSYMFKLDQFHGWKKFQLRFEELSPSRNPLGFDKISQITFRATGWEMTHYPENVVAFGNFTLMKMPKLLGPRVTDQQLFDLIDLTRPGLETVAEAVKNNNLEGAKTALAAYFRKREYPMWHIRWQNMPTPDQRPASFNRGPADKVVAHLLSSVNIPHQFGERIDWSINPTKLKYNEWTWQLSRHPAWSTLRKAYWATGDEKYAKEFADQMVAWVEDNPVPETTSGNSAGSRWRTIETGIRNMDSWPDCFFGFLSSPSFTDHALIVMLKSFYEHANHLRTFPTSGNWLAMEMCGLYNVGALFQEFKQSKEWRDYAVMRVSEEFSIQVYPDGAQTELAPGYHGVSLNSFLGILNTARLNELPLPQDYLQHNEKMYEYYLKITMPDKRMPALNDSGWGGISPHLQRGLKYFPQRTDFLYAITYGKQGTKPAFTSTWMPYAGWAIMRSGWEQNANYMHFEVGPFSTGHSHEDKLTFCMAAHGRRVLTEGGVYPYDRSQWRRYVLSSYAHNIAMVDGLEQNRRGLRECYKTESPLPNVFLTNDNYDFAEGWYNEGYGPNRDTTVTNYRAMLFIKPDFWVMLDAFTSADDREHSFSTMFHLDNEAAALDEASKTVAGSDPGIPNLAIIPMRKEGLEVEIVKGQEQPFVQGWVPLKEYEMRAIPTPVYKRKAKGQWLEPWILYPLKADAQSPVAETGYNDNQAFAVMKDGSKYTFTFNMTKDKLSSIIWKTTSPDGKEKTTEIKIR